MKSLLLVLGLGVAGIDPLGLSLLVAALAAGAKKPQVVAFCLSGLVGTVLIGIAVSFFGKQVTDQIIALIPDTDNPAWAFVELLVAGLITYWLITQMRGSKKPEEQTETKPPQRVSVLGMVVSGLAFSGVTVLDPTFFATAAIASQASGVLSMSGLFAVWFLVSQSLLVAFALAYLFDVHQPLTDYAQSIWEKIKGPVQWLFYLALVIVAIVLTADALTLFVTGAYLIPV